jgi:hypothetical protein
MTVLPVVATDLLIVAALVTLGLALVRLILGRPGPLEYASLAFPVGSGAFTWLLFLLSWATVPLAPPTILLAYALALGLLVVLVRLTRSARQSEGDARQPSEAGVHLRLQRAGLLATAVIFLAIMGPLAVLKAHSYWDAAAGWIVKGYGIALEVDIRAGQTWGAWGLSYPLNIPLQAMLFRLFDGDRLPGSMLVFPMYGVSLAVGAYRFWRRRGVGEMQSLLGMLLMLTNPLVLLHSSIGYANLPTTVYLVLGACWTIEGLAKARQPDVILGSLLLGLAGWTRAEAVSYGLVLLPALLLLARVVRKRWISVRGALLPFVILVGIWFVFGWTAVQDSKLGGAVGSVVPTMQSGEFRLFELYLIPRLLAARALEPKTWGYLFPIAGVLCLLGLPRLLRRPAGLQWWATSLTTAVFAAIPVGLFYVQSFTFPDQFIRLLNRSFDRAFLPAATMVLVLGVSLFFGHDGADGISGAATPAPAQ